MAEKLHTGYQPVIPCHFKISQTAQNALVPLISSQSWRKKKIKKEWKRQSQSTIMSLCTIRNRHSPAPSWSWPRAPPAPGEETVSKAVSIHSKNSRDFENTLQMTAECFSEFWPAVHHFVPWQLPCLAPTLQLQQPGEMLQLLVFFQVRIPAQSDAKACFNSPKRQNVGCETPSAQPAGACQPLLSRLGRRRDN